MKNCGLKIRRILTVIVVSVSMMLVTAIFSSVLVHADTISDSSVQTKSNDNIVTGTWGTAPWVWNKAAGELTIDGGNAGMASDAPWKKGGANLDLRRIKFTGKLVLPANCNRLFMPLTAVISISGMNNLYTSNVTDMSYMFGDFSLVSNLDVSHFDTSKVTNMSGMFSENKTLRNLDLSSFDTSKVTDMSSMFFNTYDVKNINLQNLDTSNVLNMNDMFYGCGVQNLDLSNFDTSKVTNMSGMFGSMNTSEKLNLTSFNTSNVINMRTMFWLSHFTDLDISNFDTSKVTDMSGMFGNNLRLKNVNVSNIDTSKVTNMSSMFYNDSKLKNLDMSNFDMTNTSDRSFMFGNNSNLSTLVIGKKNKFGNLVNLLEVPTTDGYSGKWQNIKDSNGNNINNGSLYTSEDLMTNYTPEKAGTYTWAKKSTSDIKKLYNKVKLSISYSGSMFNSQPGDSMKYKDQFNGRSMFGALDYAYNSNNYDELIKVMHDSIKKTHESIGSLQVNEAKAKELGLNVDQLKADLAKDSVLYDYSQDNDIDGINKQLDSFASVRAKYNKLVQEGVFDKSDYWTVK